MEGGEEEARGEEWNLGEEKRKLGGGGRKRNGRRKTDGGMLQQCQGILCLPPPLPTPLSRPVPFPPRSLPFPFPPRPSSLPSHPSTVLLPPLPPGEGGALVQNILKYLSYTGNLAPGPPGPQPTRGHNCLEIAPSHPGPSPGPAGGLPGQTRRPKKRPRRPMILPRGVQ